MIIGIVIYLPKRNSPTKPKDLTDSEITFRPEISRQRMFDTLPTMMGYWDNNSEDSSTISSLGTLSGDYEGGLAGQGLYCSVTHHFIGPKF